MKKLMLHTQVLKVLLGTQVPNVLLCTQGLTMVLGRLSALEETLLQISNTSVSVADLDFKGLTLFNETARSKCMETTYIICFKAV